MPSSPVDTLVDLLGTCEVIDLSQTFEEGMPTYPSHSKFFRTLWESYWHGETAVVYQLLVGEHTGTHVDAPAHFIHEGNAQHIWIDEVPLTSFLGRGVSIDVRAMVRNHHYDTDVIHRFEEANGSIRPMDIVLFNTGWAQTWALKPDYREYLKGWPGPTPALAELLRDRQIRATGADNLGFDVHGTKDFPAHYTLLGAGIPIFENLVNLDLLPPFFTFIALPLKIKDGSGSPVRAVALVSRGDAATES